MTDDHPPQDPTESAVAALRKMFTSPRALFDTITGPLLFAIVYTTAGLVPAAIAAGTASAVTAAYRLARKHDARQALFGLVGTGIALAIALFTKSGSSYFVPGTALGAIGGLLALVTVALGHPMSALLAQAVQKHPPDWYRRRDVRRSHQIVTLAWAFVVLARAAYRAWLIANDRTTALGIVSVLLGYPVTLVFLAATILFLRHRGHAGRADIKRCDPDAASRSSRGSPSRWPGGCLQGRSDRHQRPI